MSQKYPKLETKLYIDITFTDYKALRYKMTRSCHTSRTEGELLKSYLYTSLFQFLTVQALKSMLCSSPTLQYSGSEASKRTSTRAGKMSLKKQHWSQPLKKFTLLLPNFGNSNQRHKMNLKKKIHLKCYCNKHDFEVLYSQKQSVRRTAALHSFFPSLLIALSEFSVLH